MQTTSLHPPVVSAVPPSNTALQIKHLTKRFGGLTAVQDLTLEIPTGQIFGLLGPNGAGKTTTINMICGLLAPDSGEIALFGQTLSAHNARITNQIGVCPQNLILWENLTCLEQLILVGQLYDLPVKTCRQRSELLLADLGLSDKAHQLAKNLSGGMRRRLNFALALVHNPPLLVLDEPEAGLDPQSRVLLRDYLRQLAPEKTVVLTGHNIDEIERLADRVAIIDQGKLITVGTPAQLKQQYGPGDVLEIEVNANPEAIASLAAQLLCQYPTLLVEQNRLLLRKSEVLADLPVILGTLQKYGLTAHEVRLRSSSLEDVFIALTGRRLRE